MGAWQFQATVTSISRGTEVPHWFLCVRPKNTLQTGRNMQKPILAWGTLQCGSDLERPMPSVQLLYPKGGLQGSQSTLTDSSRFQRNTAVNPALSRNVYCLPWGGQLACLVAFSGYCPFQSLHHHTWKRKKPLPKYLAVVIQSLFFRGCIIYFIVVLEYV